MLQQAKVKEPILAAILSFVLGGVGQIYIGQVTKGIVLTVVVLGLGLLSCCLGFAPLGFPERGMTWLGLLCCGIPGFVDVVLASVSAIDAYVLAQRVNQGKTLGDWDWFGSSKT